MAVALVAGVQSCSSGKAGQEPFLPRRAYKFAAESRGCCGALQGKEQRRAGCINIFMVLYSPKKQTYHVLKLLICCL